MSLRARLAILYTSIVGGILLLFGVAVYASISFSLIRQVDSTLRRAADLILPNIYRDAAGELGVVLAPDLDLSADVFVQVWSLNNTVRASPNISQFKRPLDAVGLQSQEPAYRETTLSTNMGVAHLRVLTVPMVVGGRPVGALQIAASLSVLDATQRALVVVLLLGALVSMTAAGLAGWISTEQALAPLGEMTRLALQITRADDLSRRIPYQGPPDEVGELVSAFNQTLERLENLFVTQRRFIADVGHELRTPLTVIKGNLDLMRRTGEIDPEDMASIQHESERLNRLVGDLLLLAQAESGKLPLAHKLVELDTLVLEAMQQMRVLAGDRLRLRLGEIDQVLVCGDPDRLKQVVVNLIGNAIQYTPQGGEIVLGLGKVGERARLTVTDNGPGIPQEDLPHIFERFYRGEKSRRRERDSKGFGLGLSIAYWIVRNHDGQIDVDTMLGRGSTFCVWLPQAQGQCQEKQT